MCAECQTILVELLVTMLSDSITAEELALLTRLFLEKTPPTVSTASVHLKHISHIRIQLYNIVLSTFDFPFCQTKNEMNSLIISD